jgi:two-component system sensor histidine kinase KdpD
MTDQRPNPDALLAAVQRQEAHQQHGKLKIFFGMAAGVGKTYTMLDSAHIAKADGVDVVIGYIETHKRAETEQLVTGLEIIPRQKLDYRGTVLEEMDIDAILARKPQLILVDELAHTNISGARHNKRYQDVIELLNAGINVWTTINVQHFESRADTAAQITGIVIHETVPDTLLDMADEVELIDLSPEELRKRLAEGKVYTTDRIETAGNNFFRVGNLTALREMSLRLTAEHVDHKLQDYMQLKSITTPWKSGERLMVAVGPSPFSEKLIRWTRRMAYNLEASWMAVYIQSLQALSPEAQERLSRNLDLVRSLGGEVVTTTASSVSEGLLRVAHQRNVTQVVVGKPKHNGWQRLWRGGSLVDHVIRASGDIDIYVVTGDDAIPDSKRRGWLPRAERHSSWSQYAIALSIVAIVTLADRMLLNTLPDVGYQAVGLTELLAVLLIAASLGRGPALLAATLSAFSWNYLFIEPRYTLLISQPEDVILFSLYFAIAIFTGNLTARIRTQERQARTNAEQSQALYTLAHETATAVTMDEVLHKALAQMEQMFGAEVAILLVKEGQLISQPYSGSSLTLAERDYSVALWAFQNGTPAGRFTETLPMSNAQFLPLRTSSQTVGVMGIHMHQSERPSFEQANLLETFVSQIALVIERELLVEQAEQSAMLRESERLFTTLLNSISHELRTPIATIVGAASGLLDPATSTQTAARELLAHDIQSAADRLNRLVENLLDMSRLESERMTLKRDWCDMGEIIGTAVKRVDPCQNTHVISINTPPDLPLIQVDFVLIEQVLVNLLDNACTYTPAGTPIEIRAQAQNKALVIQIGDRGAGIPPELLERIFDKFYRLPGSATGGTGLGLSISRGLVEAHGGTLEAANRLEGGAVFTICLPLNGAPSPVQESTHA